jgi:hypothetical protein
MLPLVNGETFVTQIVDRSDRALTMSWSLKYEADAVAATLIERGGCTLRGQRRLPERTASSVLR